MVLKRLGFDLDLVTSRDMILNMARDHLELECAHSRSEAEARIFRGGSVKRIK